MNKGNIATGIFNIIIIAIISVSILAEGNIGNNGSFFFVCISAICAWGGVMKAGWKTENQQGEFAPSTGTDHAKALLQSQMSLLLTQYTVAWVQDNQTDMDALKDIISQVKDGANKDNVILLTDIEFRANKGKPNERHLSITF